MMESVIVPCNAWMFTIKTKKPSNSNMIKKFRVYDSIQVEKSFQVDEIRTQYDFWNLKSFKNRVRPEQSLENEAVEPYVSTRGLWKMYMAGFSACLGSLAVGACMGYSSPALVNMSRNNSGFEPMNEDEKTWVGSILNFGALIGGIGAGPFIDKFGRRTLFVASVVPFTLGWMLIAFSGRFAIVVAGRLISGICCGALSLVVPVYLSETANPKIRGFFGSCLQLFAFIGTLIAFGLGIVIDWQWLALSLSSLPILLAVCMYFMPESPRYLLYNGKRTAAIKGIRFLNGQDNDAELICQELEKSFKLQPTGRVSLKEAFSPPILKPVCLSLALMFFQQWSGFNGVQFYAGDIFIEAGYDTVDPLVCGIILGVAQTMGTFVSVFLIDRYGRKILLLISGVFMSIGLTILALFFLLKDKYGSEFVQDYGWVPVVSLGLYCSLFALAYGAIPWLIMGEILPVRVRGPASSLSTAFNWTMCFLVTKTIASMKTSITIYGTYFVYDAVCVMSCVFVACFLPETNGRSLEEIERSFASKKKVNDPNDPEGSSAVTLEAK